MVGVDPESDAGVVPPLEAGAGIDGSAPVDGSFADSTMATDGGVDTGPPPCQGVSLQCCGGYFGCPDGSTECIDGGCYATATAAAKVDGTDYLLLQEGTAKWQHIQYVKPSGLKLNDTPWAASFPPNNKPNEYCDQCFSSTTMPIVPPLAKHPQTGILVKYTGRGTVTLGPATAENGYTLSVQFNDPMNSDDSYTATWKYETR